MTMTARPRAIPIRYVETFAKDGSATHFAMRRDIRMGRSTAQLYFTACGTLIFRVTVFGLFSSQPDYVCEDYLRLEEGGRAVVTRQCCTQVATGRTAVQVQVAEWMGLEPPVGHA
jgi:hypothetical protein